MAERFPKNLVGREKELEFLKQKLEEAREGRGSTVLIAGESGVGKTRLAEEFAEICEKEGFAVLFSFCIGETEPPYLPVDTALKNYAKNIARNESQAYIPLGLSGFMELEIEERSPKGVERERTRMLEYLLRQFIAISRKQPVLFVIDDLHLADSATLAFFHYLARNIRKEKILAIGTYVE
ncbi:MAG: BREX system ATP-binding domain-containing protein, partial [Thermoplasmata archaeon]